MNEMIKSIKDKNKYTMEEFRVELLDRLQKYVVEADQIYKNQNPNVKTPYEKLDAIRRLCNKFFGASDVLDNVLGVEVRLDNGMLFTQYLFNQFFYMEQTLETEIKKQIGDPLHKEISHACENLGLTGYKGYEPFAFRRVRVFVNDKEVGIYDLDKHTFVD